jgi:hypothetical protein
LQSESAIGAKPSAQIDHSQHPSVATVNISATHPPLQSTNLTSLFGQTVSGPSPVSASPTKVWARPKMKKRHSLEDSSFYVIADLEWLKNKDQEKSAPPQSEPAGTTSAPSPLPEPECREMVSSPAAAPPPDAHLPLSDPSIVLSSVPSSVEPSSVISPPASTYKSVILGSRLGMHQGSTSQDPMVLPFEMNDEMYARVLRWNGRYSASDRYDLRFVDQEMQVIEYRSGCSFGSTDDFLCLSLVCYPTTQVAALLEGGSEESSFLETISSIPCAWPKQGGLFLNANFRGSRWNFPLAPPFAVRSFLIVDLIS